MKEIKSGSQIARRYCEAEKEKTRWLEECDAAQEEMRLLLAQSGPILHDDELFTLSQSRAIVRAPIKASYRVNLEVGADDPPEPAKEE